MRAVRGGGNFRASAALLVSAFFALSSPEPLLLPSERAALLPHTTWQARVPSTRTMGERMDKMTIEEGAVMMGTQRVTTNHRYMLSVAVSSVSNSSLPDSYDIRQKWWRCSAVSRVVNQGPCGSCYAVASADTVSASICIRSGGIFDLMFSAQDMLSCSADLKCEGGTIPAALQYLCENGAAEESCITYRAGDSWDHGHTLDACRHTCEMDEVLVVHHALSPLATKPASREGEENERGVTQSRNRMLLPVEGHMAAGEKDPAAAAAARGYHDPVDEIGAIEALSPKEALAPLSLPDGDAIDDSGANTCYNSYRLLKNEAAVKEAILNVGPVVAYIDAYRSLVHYSSGIYTCPQPSACSIGAPDLNCPLGTHTKDSKFDCPLHDCTSPDMLY